MTIRSFTLALLVATAAPALADVTIVGDGGAVIEKSRDCNRSDGQAICSVATTYLGTDGQTANKLRTRTTIAGASETEITLTGPDGNTHTRKRLITWDN